MLGPCLAPKRYHEIGRAIATLMADEVSHTFVFYWAPNENLISNERLL